MSKRMFSRHTLNVFQLEREVWEYPLHRHNFFELIFIEAGKGSHRLNDVTFSYEKGAIFLLTPEDEHEFLITEKTTFVYLKFTEQLFIEKLEDNPESSWYQKIQSILSNPNGTPGDIISDPADREHLFTLLRILRVEHARNDMFSRQAVLELFGAILILVARSVNKRTSAIRRFKTKEEEKVSKMLAYIRKFLLDKEKITTAAIAQEFYMSSNYVSIFLKKHTGLSVRKLVLETKIKMAERLLRQSSLTIVEIATRLGFTDASHFNRTFKKYRNKVPSAYRT